MKPERWYSPKQIAELFSVSHETARRWIMAILGDDTAMIQKNKGRGKRSYRLRRLPESRLHELDQFMNH